MRQRRRAHVAAGLLAACVAAAGLGVGTGAAAASASTDPGSGSGWTVTPTPPILTMPVSAVHVTVTAPVFAYDRDASGPSIPISWKPVFPLPSGMTVLYDVEWRMGAAHDRLAWEYGWAPFLTGTSTTSAAFNATTDGDFLLTNGDAYEWRVRAVDPVTAEVGPWSAAVISNIPLDDNWHHQTWESGDSGDTSYGHSWTTHAYAGDFYGADHTTTAVTFADGGLTGFYGPRLVIIGMKCPNCGKFTIDMQGGRGGHTFTKAVTVDTYATTTQHRVVLCSIPVPDSEMWLFQIDTLATRGRPRVSVDAWAVTHAP